MPLGAPNQNTGILGKLRELVVMIHRLTRGVGLKMLIVGTVLVVSTAAGN